MNSFGSRPNNLIVLFTEQIHTMVSDLLVSLRLNLITRFACCQHRLITNSAHTHEVDVFAVHRDSFNHVVDPNFVAFFYFLTYKI